MIETLKRWLFWIVARTCFKLYRWFPIFGLLRASIGIIRQGETFLVIQRNDGRGLSLPGGIAGWKETEEETLRREVMEETGLNVTSQELRMRYESRADVPCSISVFEVEASGELKNSWEGAPRWITLTELDRHLLRSQRPVFELLTKIAAQPRHEGSAQQDQK